MGNLESAMELLARAKAEIERGRGVEKTVGQREAVGVAESRMPAEAGHSGGAGQKVSNERPGPGRLGEPPADLHSEGNGGDRHLTNAGPAHSRGNVFTNAVAPTAPSSVVEIRRMATSKGLEAGKSSGGGVHPNTPGPTPMSEGRVGDVKAPVKAPVDKNKGGSGFEGRPPFAGEQLSGDGWTRAKAKAKDMLSKR